MKNKKISIIIAIFILLLALFLRSWRLLQAPASLYWEEVALAYDAWSIAETGYDYHNNAWPIVAFESFGDYKPSGYFYALALLIKILGPHDWVIRIPSVIAGVMIVFLIGQLLKGLLRTFKDLKSLNWVNLAMLLAAINPALIHVSRVAFETNLSVAFFLGGLVLVINSKFFQEKYNQIFKIFFDWKLYLGELLLILSFYTYHSMRVVAPLLALSLILIKVPAFLKELKKQNNKFCKINALINSGIILTLALILLAPFLTSLSEKTVTNRFTETSIFTDLEPILQSNECLDIAGKSVLSRIFCHRYWYWGRLILDNFVSHFNFNYLFLTGDQNLRHSIGLFGVFYPFDLVLIFLGLVWLGRNHSKEKTALIFLSVWLVIGLLPASLTQASPHLLRSLNVVPIGIILAVLGIKQISLILNSIQKNTIKIWIVRLTTIGLIGLYAAMLLAYQIYYHSYYPAMSSNDWQNGYVEALETLKVLQQENADLPVYITRELGRPSIYYLWYRQIAPQLVQAVEEFQKQDQGELITYTPEAVSFNGLQNDQSQLVILTPNEVANLPVEVLTQSLEIKNLNNELVLIVGRLN